MAKNFLLFAYSLFILFILAGCIAKGNSENDTKSKWYQLNIVPKEGRVITFPTSELRNDPILQGIPDFLEDMDTFQISFSFPMSYYKMMQENQLDSSVFYKQKYGKNKYGDIEHNYNLIGLTGWKEKNHYLILDRDYDGDFSNDSMIIFNLDADGSDVSENIDVTYQNLNYQNILEVHSTLHFKDKSYMKGDSLVKSYIDFGFSNNLESNINLCNQNIRVTFSDWTQDQEKYTTVDILLDIEKDTFQINKRDVFKIGECLYSLDSIDFATKQIQISERDSYNVFPHIESIDLNSSGIISSRSSNEPFSLIHLWGSWCRPCLKNLPEIAALKGQGLPIDFVGICVDNNLDNARTVSSNINLDWKQLYFTHKDWEEKFEGSIITFPTYFVLNEKDEIIFKTTKLNRLIKYINQSI